MAMASRKEWTVPVATPGGKKGICYMSVFAPPNAILRVPSCRAALRAAILVLAVSLFPVAAHAQAVFINEIHYDNTGTDAGEAVEIAGPAGTDLSTYSIELYNGTGGVIYDTDVLSGLIPNQQNGFGTVSLSYPVNGIQNGAPDGVALVKSGVVIQFLSYEGSFTATNGTASGMTSTDIGVSELGTEAVGNSLQLQGTGNVYTNFTWAGPIGQTAGARNTGQTFVAAGEAAPSVSSTTPADNAVDVALSSNISINFSEGVNVTGTWFDITCSTSGGHTATVSGGPSSFTLDPDANFAGNETCTVTVFAAQVTDQDASDPPDNMAADYIFDFQTAAGCGSVTHLIHDVQGNGSSSPVAGNTVVIEGVVVGDYQGTGGLGGFFVQEEDADADADPDTSEGLFVFTSTAASLGDQVNVAGTVTEFNGLTELNTVTRVDVCASGQSVTASSVSLPFASTTDAERYEGMAVVFPQTLTVSEVFSLGRFGEVTLSSGGRLMNPTNVVAPGTPAVDMQAANDLNRIVLDDGKNAQNPDPTPFMFDEPNTAVTDPTLRVGDTTTGLSGVMNFAFGTYRVEAVGAPVFTADNARPVAAPAVGGTLKLAAANVLNYFNGNGAGGGFPTSRGADTAAEFTRQRNKIIASLATLNADVVGLMEMENDSTASENAAIEDLVDGLNAALGAGTYAFIDTDVIGPDEIRVALLYKPATVTPVGVTGVLLTGTFNGFSRPPIAQAFEDNANGERFIVVVNHLKSKGCGGATGQDLDQGDGQGCYNATRVQSASELLAWLATDPTTTDDPDVVIIGDLNSYLQEDPITTLEAGGYANLLETWIGTGAYSFLFQAQSGALDNALASPGFANAVTGVAEWHTNADEPPVLDYNTEFKSAAQQLLEVGTRYRAADHDALVIGLHFEPPPSLVNGGMELDDNADLMPDGWTGTGLSLLPGLDGRDCTTALGGSCSFRLRAASRTKRLAQTVPSGGQAGDSFHVTYAAKTQGVVARATSLPRAFLIFQAADGRTTSFAGPLPVGTRDWTSYTLDAIAPFDYVKVRVEFVNTTYLGTTWIDEAVLTRD